MDLSDDVPCQHPAGLPKIKVGEAIDANPNSKTAVQNILENLSKQTEIGTTRAWV